MKEVFGTNLSPGKEVRTYAHIRAIPTPKSEDTFCLNNLILNCLEGDANIYLSDDSIPTPK